MPSVYISIYLALPEEEESENVGGSCFFFLSRTYEHSPPCDLWPQIFDVYRALLPKPHRVDGDIRAVRYDGAIATLCDAETMNRRTGLEGQSIVELSGGTIVWQGDFLGELLDGFA